MTITPATGDAPEAPRRGPSVVAPTTKVNVALPFYKIELREPSRELAELAALLAELIAALHEASPSETLAQLRDRADALALRFA